jgi:hypothetical protein
MNYEWLLMNHGKLNPSIWKYLKLEAQKLDYLLDYNMSEPQKVHVRYWDLFDNFKPCRGTPSRVQNYLNRDLILKCSLLAKTMAIFKKSYPSKTFSLVSKNLP